MSYIKRVHTKVKLLTWVRSGANTFFTLSGRGTMAGFNAPRAIPVLTNEKLKGYIYHPCFQANSSNEQSCPTIMVKYQSLCKDNYFLEQDFLMTKKKKRNHAMQSTFLYNGL